MQADQVLVGRNNTRRAYNMRVRQKQNIEDPLPVPATSWYACATTARRACSTAGCGG